MDREDDNIPTDGRIRLVVFATDKGQPSRSNETSVIVNVVDDNDNAPYFIKHDINITVKELSTRRYLYTAKVSAKILSIYAYKNNNKRTKYIINPISTQRDTEHIGCHKCSFIILDNNSLVTLQFHLTLKLVKYNQTVVLNYEI